MGCGASRVASVSPGRSPLLSKSGDAQPSASTIVVTSPSDRTLPASASSISLSPAAPPSSSSTPSPPLPTSLQPPPPPNPHHRHTLSHTEDRFTILKVLGEGASCKVVSVRDKRTQALFAMKIMDKAEPYNAVLFENESQILRVLQHPNILQLVDAYEDRHTFHLLTLFCQGGELFDRVKNGSFSEAVAASLGQQMLRALQYCHQHHIVHRDLKPENFVFASQHPEPDRLLLIDFGCARLVEDDEVITDVAGSPYYCAPEILSETSVRTGKVWKAADMWSVGVILFLLVCGFPPFNGDSQEKIFQKIRKGRFRFPRPSELGGVQLSDSVQHLITSLLQMQPGKRLTADDALQHPWITGLTASSTPLPSIVVDALSSFRSQCRLKKAAARVLLNKMTEDDRRDLKAVFSRFDVNGDGQLGPEEVTRLLRSIGKEGEEARAVLSTMDDDGDGGVSLSEFEQAAALGALQTEEQIKRSFDMFDLDHDGFITHAEIEGLCGLNAETVMGMVKEVDKNCTSHNTHTHLTHITHTHSTDGNTCSAAEADTHLPSPLLLHTLFAFLSRWSHHVRRVADGHVRQLSPDQAAGGAHGGEAPAPRHRGPNPHAHARVAEEGGEG